MWQAAWLERRAGQELGEQQELQVVAESVGAVRRGFDGFAALAAAGGWSLQQVVFTVGPFRIRSEASFSQASK
jgi:hypothetical protein